MTINQQAALARQYFTTGKRDNGDEFVNTVDGSPEWLGELIRTAHNDGQMLPDDWRYGAIVECLDAIADAEPDTEANEIRDTIEADIYTHDLTGWLHSRVDRYGYCDEAIEEYGVPTDGNPTITLLQMGQGKEYDEVFWQVWNWLESHVSNVDEDQE